MSSAEIRYALIVPAFNESKSITELTRRFKILLENRKDIEIFFVNNGSTDETGQLVNILKSKFKHSRMNFIQKDINTGYGAGIKFAMTVTSAPFIIWTHGDLQCEIIDVEKAIEIHESSGGEIYEIVKGYRVDRPLFDRTISLLLSSINKSLNGVSLPDINSQPNLVSKDAFEDLKGLPDNSTFELYFLTRATQRGYYIRRFPVSFHSRDFGVGFNDGSSPAPGRCRTC